MNTVALRAQQPSADLVTRRQLVFYLIFFAGGMPALIYQVVWQRVLTLYFGVDIYSTSITVATFMMGLGVGSLIGGRLADRVQNRGPYYAGLEALMGCIGFASIPAFSFVGQSLAGAPLATVVLVDFVLLLLPTTLMGMTLPIMCRIVIGRDENIGRHLSWLYGVNTFGAATGSLLSAYVLVGVLGLDGATYLAAALNLVLALVVYRLTTEARPTAVPAATMAPSPVATYADRDDVLDYRWVLAFSFLSGFTALGYEIVWYRVLSVILHGTVYVFGTILFFYLAGIALGSLWSRGRIDEGNCVDRFARCQLGISAYSFVIFAVIGYFSWVPPIRQIIAASFFTTFHPAPELLAGHVDVFSLYSLLDIGGMDAADSGRPDVFDGLRLRESHARGSPARRHAGRRRRQILLREHRGLDTWEVSPPDSC